MNPIRTRSTGNGTLIQTDGPGQVWAKPLADGDTAIALLNRGNTPIRITTSTSSFGLPASQAYRLQNLWTGVSTASTQTISVLVPPNSAVLYRAGTAVQRSVPSDLNKGLPSSRGTKTQEVTDDISH